MLLELLPSKLVFPPHSPPLNLTYFPVYVRNPDEIPSIQMQLFVIGVTCNDRIALIAVFKWLSLQVLEREKIPFFSFYGKDGEDRTRDLTVSWSHVLPSTPLWGSRLKMLRNKCYSSYCLLNSFSHHNLFPMKDIDRWLWYPVSKCRSYIRWRKQNRT